jgi:xanthine dehydrogenase accessory factor
MPYPANNKALLPYGDGAIMIYVKGNETWPRDGIAVVKGGGDLGTGVVFRLHRAGMRVLVTELAHPLVIRRAVAFATSIYEDVVDVEGIVGRRVETDQDVALAWQKSEIPVLADPQATIVSHLRPTVLVDATMAKKNLGTAIDVAPIVIALGPGFVAGVDSHAVIETQRGHYLGRAIYEGSAAPDSGVPGSTKGARHKRVVRAPTAGCFKTVCQIGDLVKVGQVLAYVDDVPVRAAVDGVVRGLLADGLDVEPGLKVGDIDPRAVVEHCFHISDKALAIGGGALEAVLFLGHQKGLL